MKTEPQVHMTTQSLQVDHQDSDKKGTHIHGQVDYTLHVQKIHNIIFDQYQYTMTTSSKGQTLTLHNSSIRNIMHGVADKLFCSYESMFYHCDIQIYVTSCYCTQLH